LEACSTRCRNGKQCERQKRNPLQRLKAARGSGCASFMQTVEADLYARAKLVRALN
jgi:hypothetical protein